MNKGSKILSLLLFLIISVTSFGINTNQTIVISNINGGLEKTDGLPDNNYYLKGMTPALIKTAAITDLKTVISTDSGVTFVENMFINKGEPVTDNGFTYDYVSGGNENGLFLLLDNVVIENGKIRQLIKTEVTTGSAINTGNPSGYYYLAKQDLSYFIPNKNISLPEVGAVTYEFRKAVINYGEAAQLKKDGLENFKKQYKMIRLINSGKVAEFDPINIGNRPIKLATQTLSAGFFDGTEDYIDIMFNGDDYSNIQQVNLGNNVSVKHKNGKFEFLGFPEKNYQAQLYTIRYSKDNERDGYVVIKKEFETNFLGKNELTNPSATHTPEASIDLIRINTSNFPTVELEYVTVSKTLIGANAEWTNTLHIIEHYIHDPVNLPNQKAQYDAVTGGVVTESTNDVGQVMTKDGLITVAADKTAMINGTKYFVQKWTTSYTAQNLSPLERTRWVESRFSPAFDRSHDSTGQAVLVPYDIDAVPEITSDINKADQFITINFPNGYLLEGDGVLIDDRVLGPESGGYVFVKLSTQAANTQYGFQESEKLVFDGRLKGWKRTNSNPITVKSILIGKVKSDSKVIVKDTVNAASMSEHYTIITMEGLEYLEEALNDSDEATLKWNEMKGSSYGVHVPVERIVFRISVAGANLSSKQRYINKSDFEKETLWVTDYQNMLSGNHQLTLDFSPDEDKIINLANGAKVVFSKNNQIKLSGFPRGAYDIKISTITDVHANPPKPYEVETYNLGAGKKETDTDKYITTIRMGLPKIFGNDFSSQNNIFMIEDISYNDLGNKRKVVVNFITKAQQQIADITGSNLFPADGSGTEITAGNITNASDLGASPIRAVEEVNGEKRAIIGITDGSIVEESMMQFPLDIVFCIDNSNSMDAEIAQVKNGLSTFAQALKDKGFNVKFNLITFGPKQYKGITEDVYDSNGANKVYKKNLDRGHAAIWREKWFTDEIELKTAFDNIISTSGFDHGQENGSFAINEAIELLKYNGRYLKPDGSISATGDTSTGDLKSKKWIIFLTDENMDDEKAPKTAQQLSQDIITNDITLTGIFHINYLIPYDASSLQNGYPVGEDQNSVSYYEYQNRSYWQKLRKDRINNNGVLPSFYNKPLETFYSEFKPYLTTRFFEYEMGSTGQFVGEALADAVNNMGIMQRWSLTYESPFPKIDGQVRHVHYELKDVLGMDGTVIKYLNQGVETTMLRYVGTEEDRKYKVALEKVSVKILDPDPNLPEEQRILKLNTPLDIHGQAKSQDMEIINNSETLVEYPIEKARIRINGRGANVNSEAFELESDQLGEIKEILLAGEGWYDIMPSIGRKEFLDHFYGGNAGNIDEALDRFDIRIYASRAQYTGMDVVYNVRLSDIPLLGNLTLTNETLRGMLSQLKNGHGKLLFNNIDGTMSKLNELTKFSSTNVEKQTDVKKVPYKTGDIIRLEATVFDNNLTTGLFDNFKVAGDVVVLNKTITEEAGTGQWKVNILLKVTGEINKIKLQLKDFADEKGTKHGKDYIIGETADVINIGTLYSHSNTYESGGTSGKYNLSGTVESGAIAYMVVFEYDEYKSDWKYDDARATDPSYGWLSAGLANRKPNVLFGETNNSNVKFAADLNSNIEMLAYQTDAANNKIIRSDGSYKMIPVIYPINKAGKIITGQIVHGTETAGATGHSIDIKVIIDDLIRGKIFSNREYFVDTVSPRVANKIYKSAEFNEATYSGLSSLMGLDTGPKDRAFKAGDTVTALISERNMNPNTAPINFPNLDSDNKDYTDADNEVRTQGKVVITSADLTSDRNSKDVKIRVKVVDLADNINLNVSEDITGIYNDKLPKALVIDSNKIFTSSDDGNDYKYSNATPKVKEGSSNPENIKYVFEDTRANYYDNTKKKLIDYARMLYNNSVHEYKLVTFSEAGEPKINAEKLVIDTYVRERTFNVPVDNGNSAIIPMNKITELSGIKTIELKTAGYTMEKSGSTYGVGSPRSVDGKSFHLEEKEDSALSGFTINVPNDNKNSYEVKLNLTDKVGNSGTIKIIANRNYGFDIQSGTEYKNNKRKNNSKLEIGNGIKIRSKN